jgi:Putative adhesin
MRKWLAGLIVFAAASICGAPAQAYEQAYEKTVPLSAGGALHLENVNGSVDVRAWDRPEVQIYAVKRASRSDEDLALVSIEVDATLGRVNIVTRYPQDQGVDVSVDYRIRVPRRVLLEDISTVNGTIHVTDVDGGGKLHTVNGDVDVFDCAGGFSAHTTNGDIHEELRVLTAKSPVELESVTGSILVALPANAGAELDAQSLNGDFRTEKPIAMNGAFSHGSFRGKLGAGGATLKIRTVNGAIQLAVWKPSV